ncbi:hypothetical protein [Priestia endophytica]|nr:hypothetical protein [Priestia endophytica]RPK09351.1 hypothetical protein FH5_04214 [Priestia endophytica]
MIHSLKVGRANVFVIQEEKTIIVDTGPLRKALFYFNLSTNLA